MLSEQVDDAQPTSSRAIARLRPRPEPVLAPASLLEETKTVVTAATVRSGRTSFPFPPSSYLARPFVLTCTSQPSDRALHRPRSHQITCSHPSSCAPRTASCARGHFGVSRIHSCLHIGFPLRHDVANLSVISPRFPVS
ncbi:hypothetical protein K523DRAFT_93596 [Schizophyllum commune Tattone D]|nr:hypothetical protein K523DRAFT_93596 [Schizophyllum commune Tattone D]